MRRPGAAAPRPRRGPSGWRSLEALAEPDAGDALARLVEAAGVVELAPFALARNLDAGEMEALAEAAGLRLGPARAPVVAAPNGWRQLGETIVARAGRMASRPARCARPDAGRAVRGCAAQAPEAALDAALAELAAAGRVVRDGAVLRLPEHQPRLTREDERLWQRVEPLLAAGELRPPRVRELAEALGARTRAADPVPEARRALRPGRAGRAEPLFPAGDRRPAGRDRARLADDRRRGRSPAMAYKDSSGIGRNLTIEVLEHLDAIGVTRRVGDARIVVRENDL